VRLRSLTEHLRTQNWTAVVLDCVIVIFGVFIGIQVANWNEERADRAVLERTLGRLESDFGATLEMLGEMNTARSEAMFALDDLLTSLENDEPLADEAATAGAARWTFSQMIPPPPVSFEEMVNSGRLDLIKSVGLRDALRRLQALAELTRTLNLQQGDSLSTLEPYFRFARNPRTLVEDYSRAGNADFRLVHIDHLGIWNDRAARSALYRVYREHELARLWLAAHTQAIEQVLAEIRQRSPR
jgi:hypothetical protein